MAVPEVDSRLLEELLAIGFPVARATRGLYNSGDSGLEDAVNWIIDHEFDPDIDQMPLVPVDIDLEATEPFQISDEVERKAENLRMTAVLEAEKAEKKTEGEQHQRLLDAGRIGEENQSKRITAVSEAEKAEAQRERERSRQFLEAKGTAEKNHKKRQIATRETDKLEEKRARRIVRQKLEEDKAERRSNHFTPLGSSGLVQLEQADISTAIIPINSKLANTSKSMKKAEHLTECLRNVRRSCMGDYYRAQRAFQTLQIYIKNVLNNPDVEKYRTIPFTNTAFQNRVGSVGGTEFLKLCGFGSDTLEGKQVLHLPRDSVDPAVLASALLSYCTFKVELMCSRSQVYVQMQILVDGDADS